jgi:clumping factor A
MSARASRVVATAAALLASAAAVSPASGAPTLRVQLTQRGDFALTGGSFGHDCGSATTPIVGDLSPSCGSQTGDTAPDVFWRSDSPGPGAAEAGPSIAPGDARTTAVLELPPQATVSRAFLYWAATAPAPDTEVTLAGPDAVDVAVTAIGTFSSSLGMFDAVASVADVTAIVAALGPGAYRVADVALPDLRNENEDVAFGAWWMVVLYEDPSGDLRNLAVFDGLDGVLPDEPQTATLDGFIVPVAGFAGKLGVVALEGDAQADGDQLSFDGDFLGDDENPVDNFFNGSRTVLGEAVHVTGDLPELDGEAGSMSGIDLDIVDVTPSLAPSQTSAEITASSEGDAYWLATFVTSIATFAPDLVGTVKSYTDVDGAPLVPGDTLAFDIVVRNGGNDAAVGVTLTDALATGFTYVPGSLTVDGAPRTDAIGDDTFDFDEGSATLTVRLGAGADATNGGALAEGTETVVRFEVTVGARATGTLENQAVVTAAGALGAGPASWPSGSPDGQGTATAVVIDDCSEGGCGGEGGGSEGGGSGTGGDGGAGDGGGAGAGAGGAGATSGGGNASGTTSNTAASTGAGPSQTSGEASGGDTSGGGALDDDATLRGSGLTCATAPPASERTGASAGLALAIAMCAASRLSARRDRRPGSRPRTPRRSPCA